MATASPLYRLAAHYLGEDPLELIGSLRAKDMTWRAIARELWLKTDGEIDISEVTLMKWSEDLPKNGDAA